MFLCIFPFKIIIISRITEHLISLNNLRNKKVEVEHRIVGETLNRTDRRIDISFNG